MLVALAVAVSRWRRAELESDLAVAVLRSFVQLTAVGYVIQAIFDSDSLLLVVALLAVMVAFGTFTARGARKGGAGALVPLALALGVAAAPRSAWWSPSASSRPSRATSCRSAAW